VRLRGDAASIVYGYHDAATLGAWSIAWHQPDAKHDGAWRLSAVIVTRDPFCLRQRPLVFSAKREGRMGLWLWPLVEASIQIGDRQMIATLGPPLY
jgi:hypothetical protein